MTIKTICPPKVARAFGRGPAECTSYWFPDYLADLNALLDIYSPEDPVRLNSRNVAIEGAGHMLHFAAPRALAEAIEGFLLPTL